MSLKNTYPEVVLFFFSCHLLVDLFIATIKWLFIDLLMSHLPNYIWLVDDDEDDLMLMQRAFRQVDPALQLRTFCDGNELLSQLQQTPVSPRLILLDLNMVHTGGFDALASLRAEGDYEQLPIVVLTTSSNPADRAKSERLGANGFHTKPDTFADLTLLARQLVGQWLPATA